MDFGVGVASGAAIEVVKAIYKLAHEIKANKNAARHLALQCQEQQQGLIRLFRDCESNGFTSGPIYDTVKRYWKEFELKIESVRVDLEAWVKLDLWDRITRRSQMAEAIRKHYDGLINQWTHLQTGLALQNLAMQNQLRPDRGSASRPASPNPSKAGGDFDTARAQDRQDWRDTMDATTKTLTEVGNSGGDVVEPSGSYGVLSDEKLIDRIKEADNSSDEPEDDEYRKRLIDALAKYHKGNRPLISIDPSELTVPIEVHRGDHATIYTGFRRGSKVAIKKVNLDVGVMDDVYRRIIRESVIWEKLDHPNIVRFIGCVGPKNEVPYMISEWMENDNARVYASKELAKSPPVYVDVIKIILSLDITKGLVYLHSQNPSIIHGGLKASNILIDAAGNAKVTDFALSALAADIQTGSRPPPLRWSSPEVLDGNPSTVKSDVYSFASVVLEIITDAEPYKEHKNLYRLSRLIRSGLPPDFPNSDIAKRRGLTDKECALWVLMQECWGSIPEERPTISDVRERLWHIWNDRGNKA